MELSKIESRRLAFSVYEELLPIMETWLRHGMAALSAAVLALVFALPSEVSSAAMFPPGLTLPQSCPLEAAKKNFDSSRVSTELRKLVGSWVSSWCISTHAHIIKDFSFPVW